MSKVFEFYGPQTADEVEILYDADGCMWGRNHTDRLIVRSQGSREGIIWTLAALLVLKLLENRGGHF
jgi:hypothetical protein